MAALVSKMPKSEINEFFQVHGGLPLFVVVDAGLPAPGPPHFVCTLTLPAIQSAAGGLPESIYTGEGRTKKASEHDAAQKAVGILRERGLLRPRFLLQHPPVSGSLLQQPLASQPRTLAAQPAATPTNLAEVLALQSKLAALGEQLQSAVAQQTSISPAPTGAQLSSTGTPITTPPPATGRPNEGEVGVSHAAAGVPSWTHEQLKEKYLQVVQENAELRQKVQMGSRKRQRLLELLSDGAD